MRTIIAGSRSLTDPGLVEAAVLASRYEITEVISGGAQGIDSLGELWAMDRDIKLTRVPILGYEWDLFGKAAGRRRNIRMAEKAEAAIVIWDGASRGSLDMIEVSRARGLLCYVHRV